MGRFLPLLHARREGDGPCTQQPRVLTNPAAAATHTRDWPTDWLNSLEVPGARARRGHTTPRNVPRGVGLGVARDSETGSLPGGGLWFYWEQTLEMRPRNRQNDAARLKTHLLITAETCWRGRAGSIWEEFIRSFIHSVPGEYLPQARLCLSVGGIELEASRARW